MAVLIVEPVEEGKGRSYVSAFQNVLRLPAILPRRLRSCARIVRSPNASMANVPTSTKKTGKSEAQAALEKLQIPTRSSAPSPADLDGKLRLLARHVVENERAWREVPACIHRGLPRLRRNA